MINKNRLGKKLGFGKLEVLGNGLFQAVAQLMAQMDLHAIYSNCCCSLQFYTQNRIFQAIFNEEKMDISLHFCLIKSGNLPDYKNISNDLL